MVSNDTATTIATTFEEASTVHAEPFQPPLSDRQSIFTSATSFVSDYDESQSMGRKIPDLSDMVLDGVQLEYGEVFECPYCRTIQMVMNRFEWKYIFPAFIPVNGSSVADAREQETCVFRPPAIRLHV